jgi:AcrR family transcriptional regulator
MVKTNEREKPKGREETESRLIEAALELIARNGVLAGLNLREVADLAGVNRGNIYHYFGSRQELLRAAIARRFEVIGDSMLAAARGMPFVDRRILSLRLPGAQDSQLRALLSIDGDASVDPMPRCEEALALLVADVEAGDIDPGHDLEALQVALSAFLRGYRIFRKGYARRLEVDPAELDQRVAKVFEVWLKAMASPAGGKGR